MLVLLGDGKIAEDYQEDEKIIDAERKFEYVTGDELDGNLPALPEKNQRGKSRSQGEPQSAASQRIAGTHAAALVQDAEIQHQHCDGEEIEDDPEREQG